MFMYRKQLSGMDLARSIFSRLGGYTKCLSIIRDVQKLGSSFIITKTDQQRIKFVQIFLLFANTDDTRLKIVAVIAFVNNLRYMLTQPENIKGGEA